MTRKHPKTKSASSRSHDTSYKTPWFRREVGGMPTWLILVILALIVGIPALATLYAAR